MADIYLPLTSHLQLVTSDICCDKSDYIYTKGTVPLANTSNARMTYSGFDSLLKAINLGVLNKYMSSVGFINYMKTFLKKMINK